MRLFLLSVFFYLSLAIDLPDRLKGGIVENNLKRFFSSGSDALTWDAPVDHTDESAGTYKQRYYVNDEFWDNEGPLFVYIGGEGTVSGPPSGYLEDLAPSYHALLVSVEHRFYGESIPNNDMSTSNLKYLTVEQALDDLASFISFFRDDFSISESVQVFTFGGSYPGALSSWFEIRHPESTVGSLSSSGVVNAILDFPEFDEQVSLAIGEECSHQIIKTRQYFEQLTINGGKSGLDYGLSLFQCDKQGNGDMSIPDFHYMIADSWSMADQYGSKDDLCNVMLSIDENATPLDYMTTFAQFTMDFWGTSFCSCFYNTACLSDPERWVVNERSWRWQKCYELAYFQVAPQENSLRSQVVDMNYHLEQCSSVFGIDNMTPQTDYINSLFGGSTPTASNVFYSDFWDDPWNRASVNQTVSEDQPFVLTTCDGCGHCQDLHGKMESDPQPLKDSRSQFEEFMKSWLEEDRKN